MNTVVRGLDSAEASSFRIKELVIHEVPARAAGSTGSGPVVSEFVVPLTKTLRTFFEDRLRETLGTQAQPVEEDPSTGSKVPSELRSIAVPRPTNFLSVSQDMARHLYLAQNLSNSEGLLVVATGTTQAGSGRLPAALVMKLEKSEGANVTRQKKGGKVAFAPQHVQDLMLSDKTRVFKAAVVRVDGGKTLVGIVSDEQTRLGAENFRGVFLGCRLSRSPAVVTREFSEIVDRWISDNISDSGQILKYRTALRAELDSHATQLSPQNFVAKHMDPADRQPLEDYLKERSIPMSAFEKSKAQLKPRHLRTRSTTQKGLQISGDAELMGQLVEPYTMPDGEHVTLIHDVISN